ncbi:polysaccharide biosynthesis tyrosine autokinase [Rahnella victoriana]|uniref:polysaccharide biosynthesis tyrosine autokinase n=1 Tax=Rahnella victoriana TaxID=1510570 RepID=UPI000E6D34C8|nr:polysaccharide biosynthesis tyrosine autokinase [Rahnella victoriana]UHM89915.1 polysaccharide biosynthesis tyrosine autokinase [Rahnella victoriana]
MTKNIIDSSSMNNQVNEIDLGRIISHLVKRKWIIITSCAVAMVLGIIAAATLAPSYKVNSVIQINTLPDDMYVSKSSSAEEIQWITSRNVIEKTVNTLNKTISIEPKHIPVIGGLISKLIKNDDEPEITITRLDVPREVINQEMLLTIEENGKYKVQYNSKEVISGTVGEVSKNSNFTMLLNGTNAPAGSQFILKKNNLEDVISNIQKRMNVIEQAKDSGLLTLTLTGDDEGETIKLLDSIVRDYVQNKNNRNISDADQSLVGVNQRLEQVSNDLDLAEKKLNELNEVTRTGKSLSQKQIQDAATALNQINSNNGYNEIGGAGGAQNDTAITALPGSGQQILLRLTREILTGQELNVQLQNQKQRLELIKSASINDVRVVDPAFEENSSTTILRVAIVLIAGILGVILSSGFILTRALINKNLQNASDIELLGMTVSTGVSLPKIRNNEPGKYLHVLEERDSDFEESLRTVRTHLSYLMAENSNNVIVISTPQISGAKNVLVANLAIVFANAGKKTLLIDNDIKSDSLGEVFDIESTSGLSEYLNDEIGLTDILKSSNINNLDVMTSGNISKYSTDKLLSTSYHSMIEKVREIYDVVIINCPAILKANDTAIVGRFSECRVIVVNNNEITADELKQSNKRLLQNGVKIETTIFCMI